MKSKSKQRKKEIKYERCNDGSWTAKRGNLVGSGRNKLIALYNLQDKESNLEEEKILSDN